jgi:hypothetical protein
LVEIEQFLASFEACSGMEGSTSLKANLFMISPSFIDASNLLNSSLPTQHSCDTRDRPSADLPSDDHSDPIGGQTDQEVMLSPKANTHPAL